MEIGIIILGLILLFIITKEYIVDYFDGFEPKKNFNKQNSLYKQTRHGIVRGCVSGLLTGGFTGSITNGIIYGVGSSLTTYVEHFLGFID